MLLASNSIGPLLTRKLKDTVLDLLNGHRIMSISTNRADGWPQTTLVSFINDGFLLYCFVARNSQKYENVVRDPRVSIAIGSDVADPREIKGLSLAGRTSIITDADEFEHVAALRSKRYPEYAGLAATDDAIAAVERMLPRPSGRQTVLSRSCSSGAPIRFLSSRRLGLMRWTPASTAHLSDGPEPSMTIFAPDRRAAAATRP